jgi:dolichyl-phosphate beta-glucosyltransferase
MLEKKHFDLSIIIPAYNEEKRLPPVLAEIEKHLCQSDLLVEVLVINDGSRDNTALVAQQYIQQSKLLIQVISLDQNSGKGAAIKAGVNAAHSDFVLIYDADGATPISELERIWPKRSHAKILIGSRALDSNEVTLKTRVHRKGLGRLFNLAVNLLVLPGLKDTQCGFKLVPTAAAQLIFSKMYMQRFSFDVELLFIAKKIGLEIQEIAINWSHIPGSKVNVIRDGIRMFFDLIRIRYLHRKL